MKITVAMLRKKSACDGEVQKFQERFGDEAELTPELIEYVRQRGQLDWPFWNTGFLPRRLQRAALKAIKEAHVVWDLRSYPLDDTYTLVWLLRYKPESHQPFCDGINAEAAKPLKPRAYKQHDPVVNDL